MKPNPRLPLAAVGLLAAWGCGPPVVTQALPPGVTPPAAQIPDDQQAEALGEQSGMATVEPTVEQPSAVTSSTAPPTGDEASAGGDLQVTILKEGTGEEAKPGQQVSVHYVGKLTNGTQFDSSRDSGQPYSFRLGGGQVIQGWDRGVAGMKVGEVRQLTIPSSLGYGERGSPPVIPPNATLVFEIELLDVK